ncbi:MAG: hypothetical protein AB7F86_11220 [Bdellovibrionales bacterium]
MSKVSFTLSWVLGIVVFISGCQTPQQRDTSLVRDRMEKLKPLSKYSSTVCELKVEPTAPAKARFAQMFPGQVEGLRSEDWVYKWRQTENYCQISASSTSVVIKEQKSFLQSSFCRLLQAYYVNSPFDELKGGVENIHSRPEAVQISWKKDSDFGIYLDRSKVGFVTKTKSRGELSADYRRFGSVYLPERLEQKHGEVRMLIDQIQYASKEQEGRRPIESMWFSMGNEKPMAQAKITVQNCKSL